MTKVTAICQECDKQFEYDLKPGFPRKYCVECGEIKKASFAERQQPKEETEEFPIERPGEAAKTQPQAPEKGKNASFYISYAKDIFCNLVNSDNVNAIDCTKAMKDSGCKEISFGVESFDNDVLKMLNKRTTDKDNAKALGFTEKVGIKTRVLFMIRTPGQTRHTVRKNIEWLNRVPYHIIACSSFIPLPGSDTWNNPDKYNIEILNKNLNDYNFYFYGNAGGDDNIKDIIKIKDRSLKEFNEETIEFRTYLDNTGKIHKG